MQLAQICFAAGSYKEPLLLPLTAILTSLDAQTISGSIVEELIPYVETRIFGRGRRRLGGRLRGCRWWAGMGR